MEMTEKLVFDAVVELHVRDKNQLTLPVEVLEHLRVKVGSHLRCDLSDAGVVHVFKVVTRKVGNNKKEE
jgi:bifunctional DNA-binding transcriptional regulator/antitoxin component of YhaV-PrlF toxin-antitoxin module